jgi:hypothetical protein
MSEQRLGKNACHFSDASIEQPRWHAVVPLRRLLISRMVKIFERVFPPVFIFLLSKTSVNPKGLQGITDYSD